RITLEKGFTVLTGPNGSGKTNIVDAVLFGLGELSARRLRAENFSKLSFHGSPDVGMGKAKTAKVVIQFDNYDNRIAVDTNTVTISRKVYEDGHSVYRFNGRRISRSRIVDLLSMAGISPTGHNVVVQGTITRMAEISSYERRKMIEDLVGIAQYDAEKAEAEEKLRAAEISIRTAMGRVDEVQRRVDDLERERNELLRYNFIHKEIKRFEATKTSYETLGIERRSKELSLRVEEAGGRVEKLRRAREQLRSQRYGIETEWRRLSSEIVEEGGTKVFEVQVEIGDTKSKLTELATRIDTGTVSLGGLKKVKDNNVQQLEAIKNEIEESHKKIRKLRREHDRISKEIAAKQSQHHDISSQAAELRENLGENSKKIRDHEQQLDKLSQNLVALRGNHARSKAHVKVLSRRLTDLHARKEKFASNLNEVKKSLDDLKEVQKEQKDRLKNLQRTLDRRIVQRESVQRELVKAEKIAESAREAVVEFATQRELAEQVAREERALRNIEELAELGVLSGVYGRLRDLIKVESAYEQAIEVAAAGWLDSIVVRDFDAAFACTETLKRLKLGRVKIIPIRELSNIGSVKPPKVQGFSRIASASVKCAKRHWPAVVFVFGDTVITEDDKTAFSISRDGYRTVTTDGDLYEAGGGLESGYYRAPIDFSSIIPSESAVESLDQAVKALQDHLKRQGSEIATFEEEVDETRVEIARLSEAITTLEGEIARVYRSIRYTKQNVRRVDKHIQRVQRHLEDEKMKMGLQKAQHETIQKKMRRLRKELAEMRLKVDLSRIQEMELQREKLGDEIIGLRQGLGSVETELSTLRSKLGNVLKVGSNNIRIQLRRVKKQISTVESDVEDAIQQKETLKEELLKLEKSKEELSQSVLTAREEAKKFSSQIDSIDEKLQKLDAKYERADHLFNELQLKRQTLQLQLDQYRVQLKELGYEEPFEVTPEQLGLAEASLKLMGMELERLGAVNQLAFSHYAEQISRYKELSLRMNELEREKQAILSFMDEIERKKRRVFMEAFNQMDKNLSRYFSKLTGGGDVSLKLEKPEDPFTGGIDMLVQFPDKPPILVSGASSGERSVAAVAFIFALQDYTPAAFYLLDEIDAHMDAFHVAKLGELLAEESAKSQFLVVTLKPEMVSKAEKVYGVYERNGVSHVISAKFAEAT
ncbi:MAG: AAA family ATPase, partial [Candidatus Bathyarchaeia archaeon]